MSLFDSITGPKWQHPDPQVRKAAVEQLDERDVLLELVRTDPDATVQSAALARIDDPDVLDKLIETLTETLQQQAKNQRLQQILPSAGQLAAINDDAILSRIINLSDDAELQAAAIARIGDDAVRMEIASSHPSAKARLNAALGIDSMALLGELMQRAKGHDKAVFRHCKTLVDEHQAQQLAAAERQEKIRQLCDKAQEMVTAVDSPDYENNYRVLVAQWRTVKASASPAQQEQFQRDQAACAQRLVKLADARAAEEQAQTELAAVGEEFAAIVTELKLIDATVVMPQDRADIAQLAGRLDELENRWQAARNMAQPTKEQAQTCGRYLELWRSNLRTLQGLHDKAPRLDKILNEAGQVDATDYHALQRQIEPLRKTIASLPWPESHQAQTPVRIVQLQQALTQLRDQLDTLEKDQHKHIGRLQKSLDTLRAELDQNHSKEANRALVKARRSLKSLAPKQRQRFEGEIQPLVARLKEVDDWRNFAVEPKKVELCARMSALIGSEENAEILAARIRLLQDEWKQLGALPHGREQILWNDFKAAADEAWKPCKAAFEQQAIVSRENFAQRMHLVEQLTEYEEKMAWPPSGAEPVQPETGTPGAAPDWRVVQKTLDTARAAFRAIKPVDQKADRISHKAFRAICDRIYSHIKEEYGRNIAVKEQLVDRAQQLSAMEDLPQAIEQCKRLQREWKAAGITPVAVDRKLWKAFRAACDAVFARMDEQRGQQSAELKARVEQAEALRDQARALLASKDDEQGLQLNKDLSALKHQLREIELPQPVQQRLARDFQAMETQARDIALEIRRRQEQASWTCLQQKITACAQKAGDAEADASLLQGLPKGIDTAALAAFWQQGPSAQNEEQLREACIALEVAAEVESPAADKAARMNYQMRRLAAGMGRRNEEPEPSLEDRIECIPGAAPIESMDRAVLVDTGESQEIRLTDLLAFQAVAGTENRADGDQAQHHKYQGHAQAERGADVGHAVKAPAETADQVHHRVEQRDLLPQRRQDAERIKTAAEEGQRGYDQNRYDLQFFPVVRPDTNHKAEQAEGHRGQQQKTQHPQRMADVVVHEHACRQQNDETKHNGLAGGGADITDHDLDKGYGSGQNFVDGAVIARHIDAEGGIGDTLGEQRQHHQSRDDERAVADPVHLGHA